MTAAPTYADRVAALVAGFSRTEYPDELALLNLQASIEYLAAKHGAARVLSIVAEVHEGLADRVAAERDERIAKLRGLN